MSSAADNLRRRALAARAPGLTAAQLTHIATITADLALLESGDRAALAAAGLAPGAIAWLAAPDRAQLDADLRFIESAGVALLAAGDAGYPELLRHTSDPPPVIYIRGNPAALAEPQLAIVGSRNPTPAGRSTAREFAAWFAKAGVAVTSGLALGIDAACHEGALAGGGITIAVLGCGLDETYPAQHVDLAERIALHGALVTEFPPQTPPRRENFPQRNRIIAGLAAGTLVVEAAQRSGSLITARLAGAAGREVFAVPSSIHNPLARGCHELIRQGAKLVERPEEILSDLKITYSDQILTDAVPTPQKPALLDKAYKILLDALAFEPASVDSLIERTGMNSESIASMLLILELDGHVAPLPGGRYSRMAGK